jgi:transcriptional regulator NrdR family protein
MVQRSPETSTALTVAKRDGRRVAFDGGRLAGSIGRALEAEGREDATLAADLGSVVTTYLLGHARAGEVGATEISELVFAVLSGAGCEQAAAAFRAISDQRQHAREGLSIRRQADHDPVRGIPRAEVCASNGHNEDDDAVVEQIDASEAREDERWSKGRVVALLASAAELPDEVVDEVAAEVERGLFDSGLRSVSAALLREWIDNALVLRGYTPRLGQHQFVGLSPHEVREILGGAVAGPSAESEVSTRLLGDYALREVFPAEVAAAHERGLISLENLSSVGRLDTLTLSPWSLPALGSGGARRERMRTLAPLLRNLLGLNSRELVLDWDGPALDAEAVSDLLAGLATPALERGATARPVVCLPADRPGLAAPFLSALGSLRALASRRDLRLPCVRLPGHSLPEDVLTEAVAVEGVDGRLQFGAGAAEAQPEPGPSAISGSVAVNVAHVALAAGSRRVHEFLAGLERAVELALSALAAQAALLDGCDASLAAVRDTTGLRPDTFPVRRRLALTGVQEASMVLLGDGPRGRKNRVDLAAAMAERLASLLGAAGDGLVVGLASPTSRRRFGLLDLGNFPDARERLPIASDRSGFRYDGPQTVTATSDAGEAGREAARVFQLLGMHAEAPVPRCTGSTEQRLAFLRAYLSVTSPQPDLHPCG